MQRAPINRDSDYTTEEQAAVPSPVHQQDSDQACQPIAGNNGFDDLTQQIRELRQEVRQLQDDEKKTRKRMQQQLEEQEREWMPSRAFMEDELTSCLIRTYRSNLELVEEIGNAFSCLVELASLWT